MGVWLKQNRMKLFNCSKTVCMTFKAKTAKSTVIPLLTLGVQRVKSVPHYKYLVIPLDIKLSDRKNIQRQLQYKHYAVNKLRSSFSRCSNSVKNIAYFFVPSLRPCVDHSYGVISGKHTSTDCVWPGTLFAGLCKTCRGKRVLVVIRFNVILLRLRPY